MNFWGILFLQALGLVLLPSLQAAPDWSSLNRAVVHVESVGKETGTGMVISASPQSIRILTAAHVITDADSVRVYFNFDRAVPYKASIFPRSSDALDLAVLEVTPVTAGRALPTNIPQIPRHEGAFLKEGDTVWSVDFAWRPVPNTVASLDHEADPQHFEYTTRGAAMDGFSGGPVFDDAGKLVGVHHGGLGGGQFVVAVKVNAALETLAALGYATPNISSATPQRSTQQTPVNSTVAIGILGSALTFDSAFWARTDSSTERVNLASVEANLRASLILEDIQTPISILRSRIIDNLGGPSAVQLEAQRIIPIRGEDYTFLRLRRGTEIYLTFYYSGPAGTLQAVVFGPDAEIDASQAAVDALVGGIVLRRR